MNERSSGYRCSLADVVTRICILLRFEFTPTIKLVIYNKSSLIKIIIIIIIFSFKSMILI